MGEGFPTDYLSRADSPISLTLVTEIAVLSTLQFKSWKDSVTVRMVFGT